VLNTVHQLRYDVDAQFPYFHTATYISNTTGWLSSFTNIIQFPPNSVYVLGALNPSTQPF